MIRVAFLIEAYADRIAGPKNSVTLLAKSLAQESNLVCDVFSVLTDTQFEFNEVIVKPWSAIDYSKFDVYVFSGIYNMKYISIAKQLRAARIPYVVSPRGSLTKGSFSNSWLKKALFMAIFGMRYLRGSKSIHFLTEEELANSLNFGVGSFVAGNGVVVEAPSESPGFEARRNVILFIGRLDVRHKGIDLLLAAISRCAKLLRTNGWCLELHGDNYRGIGNSKVSKLVERYGIGDLVKLGAEVDSRGKLELFNSSKYFIHASRYEGQPQAVLEAITNGIPVIVSSGTNLSKDVLQHHLGWSASNSVDSLEVAISSAVGATETDWNVKSSQCKLYADQKLRWTSVAQEFTRGLLNQKIDVS